MLITGARSRHYYFIFIDQESSTLKSVSKSEVKDGQGFRSPASTTALPLMHCPILLLE